ASPPCCTPGARRSPIIPTSTSSFPAAACRRTRIALDRLQARLLPSRARALASVPPPVSQWPVGAQPSREPCLLRRTHPTCRPARLRRRARAVASLRMGGVRQEAVRRTEGRPRLSVALHPSRRHLEFAAHCVRRQGRHLPLEGLSSPRQRARKNLDQADDARRRRVHPPLPPPCAAERLPPHPPLRALRQRQPRREHRNSPRTARRRPACRRPSTAAGCHRTRRVRCPAR